MGEVREKRGGGASGRREGERGEVVRVGGERGKEGRWCVWEG